METLPGAPPIRPSTSPPSWRSWATNRRLTRSIYIAMAAVVAAVVVASRGAEADQVAVVTPPDGLFLREGPGSDKPIVVLIPGGSRIALLSDTNEDGWRQAQYQNRRGWVSAAFLLIEDSGAMRKASVGPPDGLNLRVGPSNRDAVITVLPGGAPITASNPTTDGWVYVLAGDQAGWVNGAYVTYEGGATPTLTPQPTPSPTATPAPTRTPTPAAVAPASTGEPGPGATRIIARYYHPSLAGGQMYCGGVFSNEDPTVIATTTWPCGTTLRVCYGGQCIVGVVRDRGHMGWNEIDLSMAGFSRLAPLAQGVLNATAEIISP